MDNIDSVLYIDIKIPEAVSTLSITQQGSIMDTQNSL